MGIEKLIPRDVDLGVFLRLLARSATGQPITTYSSHFHGPRPGCEMHIVLVDNGRTEILKMPEFRRSLDCIRCGACMNTCPVYRRSGGHSYEATVPGPIGSILTPFRRQKNTARCHLRALSAVHVLMSVLSRSTFIINCLPCEDFSTENVSLVAQKNYRCKLCRGFYRGRGFSASLANALENRCEFCPVS